MRVAIAPGGPIAASTAARAAAAVAADDGTVKTHPETVRASDAMSLASGGSLAT